MSLCDAVVGRGTRAIARAQETVRRYTDQSASLVDELIDERRAEARSK